MRLPFKTLAAAATLLTSAFVPAFSAEFSAAELLADEPAASPSLSVSAGAAGVELSYPGVMAAPLGAVNASDIYAPTPVADPSGVFAGPALTAAHNQGTWRVAMLWYRGVNDADIHTQKNGSVTWATTLARLGDQARAYFASTSGGKLDLVFDVIEVPLDARADGSLWSTGAAKSEVLPTLGVNLSNYGYVANFFGNNTGALISNPNNNSGSAGLGTGAASGTGHSETWFSYTIPSTFFHELGHNLNYGHARSFSNAAAQYTYDYTAKRYVPTSGTGSGPVQNIPIGNGLVEYGHSYSVMAAYPGDQGLTPRQKKANGWLEQKHFANVNALTAKSPDGVAQIRLYDDMADRDVVTNGLTGDALAYGVKNPYADVYYNATLLRPGETFDTGLGKWIASVQTLDFYYRSHVDAYPGLGMPWNTAGVVVDLNNVYMGVLTPGQSFIEKDFSQSLSSVDMAAYAGESPLNPDRYRSVWYRIDYLDNGADGFGHFANLRVTALTGAQVVGWLWDADPLTAGAQDGSGVWNATDTRWRSVSLGVDNQNWTAGEDAVFGNRTGSGAAGTVTVSGNVSANSLAFHLAQSGTYTLVKDAVNGGVITLGAGGLVAEADVRLGADISLAYSQIWSVSNGKALELTGALTQNGNTLTKMGQGTLLLSTERTWNGTLAVVEGPVTQTASQTFSGGGNLSFGEAGEYNIEGGSLILAGGKSVSGSWGLMRLNAGGSDAAPEIVFQGNGTLSPNLLLSAGSHYIRNAGDAYLSGHISGAGGIVKTGAGALYLNNTNDFTGSVTVSAGSLVLSCWDSIGAANDIVLNGNRLLLDDEIAGDTAVIGNLSGTAAASISATNSADRTQRTLEITQGVAGEFAGVVSNGAGGQVVGLAKSGAATLTLSGNNTYTGATAVKAGTLVAGSSSALGVNSAVSVASGATLAFSDHSLTLGSLAGAGAVNLGSGTMTVGANNASTVFSGALGGTGGLIKNGAGTLTLSGQNTYAGVTRVNAGGLRLDFSAASAPASDIISAASALEFSGLGGDVTVVGRDGAAVSQTFASTAVNGGISSLRIERKGAGTVDVNLGAITRTAGTLDFAGGTGADVGARFITSTGAAGAMLPGGAWATVDGVNWAAKDATNTYIVAYSNYLDIATGTGSILNSPTANVRVVDGAAGPVSLGAASVAVNSLLMGAQTYDGVIATAGKTLQVGAVSVAANSRNLTLGAAANDGVLNGSAGQLLLLSNLASSSGALTVNAAVADSGATPLALTVSGGANAGTVVLAGDNTYTGGTFLTNGGTLRVGAGGATGTLGSGAVSLDAGTHLAFNRSDSHTLANLVTGEGDLTQSGTGTLVVTGDNTYSGGTRIASGTLRVGDSGTAGTLGSGGITVDAGATLEFLRSDALTLANALSGAGRLVKSGSNTLTLSALNSGYTGDITVNAGTLSASAGTGVGSASAFGSGTNAITVNSGATLLYGARRAAGYHTGSLNINGGTVTINGQDNTVAAGNAVTFDTAAGRINGSGQWRMRDAGSVVVTSAASGSAISVTSLTLTGAASGAYAFHVADGAHAADLTVSSAITGQSGGESLVKTGAGTLRLSGANTYTGSTTVSAGTLLLSGDGNLGAGKLSLGSATLAFTNEGLRRTSLSGSSLDTTTPANGALITTDFSPLHSTASGVIPTGATYAYTGKIYMTAGQWSFGEHYDDAAYVKIGDNVVLNNTSWSSASSGSLTIGADGWYDIDLRVWNNGGGGAMWSSKGVGIRQGGTSTSESAYTRFENGALGIALVATGDVSVDNDIELTGSGVVDTSALQGGASLVFSGAVSGAGSLEKVGASALTLSGANSYTGATTVTAGTVRLASAGAFGGKGALAVASGATFDAAGNSFETAALSGAGSVILGSATVTATSGNFSGVVSGDGGLTKSGAGTLTLSGKNTYTGATTVNSGALRLDFGAASGADAIVASASRLVLDGGRLDVVGHATVAHTQAFASTVLTTETAATVSLTSAGALVTLDLGAFTRTGGGAIDFVLDANASANRILLSGFAAGARLGDWATVNGGSAFAAMDATGTYVVADPTGFTAVDVRGGGSRAHHISNDAAKDVRIIQGGTTVTPVTLSSTTTAVRSLMVTATDAATVDFAAGQTLVVAGASGVGAIVHGGVSGGITLGTAVNRGVLTAGAGTTELILGNMSPANGFVVNAKIADNGAPLTLTKSGAGTLTLNAANTYTGGTNIAAGTLHLGGAGSLGAGSYAGAIANAGTLRFSSSANQTLSGDISGSGSIVKDTGAGTLTLSGENTYSGGTTVSSGTLSVASAGALGTGALTVASGGTLAVNTGATVVLAAPGAIDGAVVVNAGALRLGSAGAYAGAGSLTVNTGATFDASGYDFSTGTLSGAGTLALGSAAASVASGHFSGVISGDGSVVKTGSGELTLSGENTYAGATTVSAGKLTVSGRLGGGAYSGAIANSGVVEFASASNQTLSGVISGAGSLVKSGSGDLTVSGFSSFTGSTAVTGGVLKLGSSSALGAANAASAKVSVAAGGTFDLNGVSNANYGMTIAGTGSAGQGALVNSGGALSHSNIQVPNLTLGGDATIGGTGHFAMIASGYGANTLNLAGYTLTKSGTNTVYLCNTTVTAGAIAIASGTLSQTMSASNASAASVSLANASGTWLALGNMNLSVGSLAGGGAAGGNVNLGSGTLTVGALNTDTAYAGVISGTNGSLAKVGSGTLILTGANTYTGVTTISAGTLRLGDGVTDGAIASSSGVTNNAALVFNTAGLSSYSKVISGTGTLTKTGAGTLTLSGENTYTGATSVEAGRLTLNGANASALTIASGASLGGSGGTAGSLTFADGAGYFVSGAGFTATDVTLLGALAVTFDAAPTASGSVVLNYGATLTGNLALLSSTNARALFTNDAANRRIVATQVAKADVWNTASGAWDNGVSANWTNGAEGKFFQGDSVAFRDAGQAATVTLTGDLTPTSVVVSAANDYTFAGTGRIIGATGLVKSGAGTLTLANANTFTGAVSVEGGTVRLAAPGAFTGGGALSVASGATFDANGYSFATSALTGGGALALGSATVTVSSGNFSGEISGAGALTKVGAGTLTLSGNNTYGGATNVTGGTLALGASGALGSGALTVSGATLDVGAYSDTVGAVTLTSGSLLGSGGVLNATSYALRSGTVTANLGGAGSLNKTTGDTVTLAGANSYTGTTSVGGGTLVFSGVSTVGGLSVSNGAITLASGAAVSAPSVSLANGTAANAALNIGEGASLTTQTLNVGASYNAGGTIQQTGGTVTLLAGGWARLGHWGAGTTSSYTITGGTLDATALAGNSGAARVINVGWDGSASMTVGGGAGTATVKAYGIQLDASGATGGNDTLTLSSRGVVELGAGGIAGASVNDRVILNGGSLRATSAATWSAAMTANAVTVSTFDTNGNAVGVSGVISGDGALTKSGAGTLTMSANNTYTGATSVDAGKLVISGSNASSVTVGSGAVFGGAGSTSGSVTFSDGATYAASSGVFTASGGVTLVGALNVSFDSAPAAGQSTLFNYGTTLTGNLALISANGVRAAFSNDTANKAVLITVSNLADVWNTGSGNWDLGASANWANGAEGKFYNGDTVTFNDAGAASTVTLAGALTPAAVTVNNTNAYTFAGSGSLGGTSTLTKTGAGTLTVETANTYTGGTTLSEGTLLAGSNTAFGTGLLRLNGGKLASDSTTARTLTNAATLGANMTLGDAARSGLLILNGAFNLGGVTRQLTTESDVRINGVVSNGGLTKSGAGTLTLSGANNYTGATTVSAGTLKVTGGLYRGGYNASVLTVNAGGTLELNDWGYGVSNASLGGLSANVGNFVIDGGTVRVVGAAATSYGRGVTVRAGGATLETGAGANWTINTTTDSSAWSFASGAAMTLGGAGTGSFDKVINSGSGTLTKSGTGTWTLKGINTYTGATTVNGGVLVAGNSKAFGTSAVTVNSGGTLNTGLKGTAYTLANAITVNTGGRLMGAGTLSGSVNFASGAVAAPGNSVDTLTFANGATFASGSVYEWEFSGANLVSGYTAVAGVDYDLMLVTGGALNIGSGTTLKVSALDVDYSNSFWSSDHTFSYATIAGTSTATGQFTLQVSGAGTYAPYGSWSLAASGYDVVWTAVPEPATYGLLGAGVLGLAALARRRRAAKPASGSR